MRLHRLTVLLVGATVALASVGCSSNGSDSSSSRTTTTTKKSSTTTTTTAADPGSGSGSTITTTPAEQDSIAALKAKMVQKVDGYELQPETVGGTGPSDLAKAQSADGTKEGAAQLEKNGFRLGYQEAFANKDQDQLVIYVYQYKTAAGAKASCDFNVKQDQGAEQVAKVTHITVPGVPTLYAADAVSAAQGSSATLVEFVTGVSCARIIGIGKTRAGYASPAAAVAAQQYALLK